MDDAFVRDLAVIDEAGLDEQERFVARAAVSSLRFLQDLSADLGKPIAEIRAEDIVAWFKERKARGGSGGTEI